MSADDQCNRNAVRIVEDKNKFVWIYLDRDEDEKTNWYPDEMILDTKLDD